MYTVIGATKTRTFRVMWLLEEIGQAYDHVPVPPGSADAKAHNPSGKIPALVDDGETLTDSVAIMTYLADKHGMLTAPAGTTERARQDATTLWLIDDMDALLWAQSKYTRLYPEDYRVPEITPVLEFEYGRTLKRLEKRLADQPFLMGEQMTVPDILAVHCIGWGFIAGFPPPPKAVAGYSKRLRSRPAYKAAALR